MKQQDLAKIRWNDNTTNLYIQVKLKNIKDANTINLVDTWMDRNTERSIAPDTDRPTRKRKIVKVPVAWEPLKSSLL